MPWYKCFQLFLVFILLYHIQIILNGSIELSDGTLTDIDATAFWLSAYIYIPDIGLGLRVFANGPGDLGSIPGRVIPKTQKMVLDASLLNTQHYKVRIKGKVEQSREGVAPSPTHWCSSYRKGSLRVTLDYGRQLYFTFIYIYIYIYIYILHGTDCESTFHAFSNCQTLSHQMS